jgi:hypothetical protein
MRFGLILVLVLVVALALAVGRAIMEPPELSCGGFWQDGVCII